MRHTEAEVIDETVIAHLIAHGATVTDPPADEKPADEEPVGRTESIEATETPGAAATRILEIATVTADQLVDEARAEAATLVAAAQAEAAELLATITAEVEEVANDLARRTNEQNAELDLERTTVLTRLGEQKEALQQEIDALHQLESAHRARLRGYLNDQLVLLGDDEAPEAPVAVAS